MISIWLFIGALGIFIAILLIEHFRYNRLLKLLDEVSEELEYSDETLSGIAQIAGYYRLRFGDVTVYDMQHMVGVSPERLAEFEAEYGLDKDGEDDK